nr:hypothetical protein [uncultured Acetobacterium sp.]
MGKAGMSTHSEDAFKESLEIRILSDFLESAHTIKTFFSENDKTPNFDGSFELINKNREPKKKFIAQVKKVENLEKCNKGKNKGKYIYRLKTNFLYYVKAKVTESPSIYFIVDIITKKIFYLYLTDEVLMQMDFEDQETVTYAFTDNNIVTDIKKFTLELDRIVSERNRKFIGKSKQEIIEIQDALEYINDLFCKDLGFIKSYMFKDLWRFGIAHSSSDNISLTHYNENGTELTISSQNTSAFAIYPQFKGELDYGLQEYYYKENYLLNTFDMTGKKAPMEYSKEVTVKILENYFNESFDIFVLPIEALEELAYVFINCYDSVIEEDENRISYFQKIEDVIDKFKVTMSYFQYLIKNENLKSNEKKFREVIIKSRANKIYVKKDIDLLTLIKLFVKPEFIEYCQEHRNCNVQFSSSLMKFVEKKYIVSFLSLMELKERKIDQVRNHWKYEWTEIINMSPEDKLFEIRKILKIWFENLKTIYLEVCENCFNDYTYVICKEIKYSIGINEQFGSIKWFIKIYPSDELLISESNEEYPVFASFSNSNNCEEQSESFFHIELLKNKTLYYDGLRCLLYEGICKALNLKCTGIDKKIGINMKLFF